MKNKPWIPRAAARGGKDFLVIVVRPFWGRYSTGTFPIEFGRGLKALISIL